MKLSQIYFVLFFLLSTTNSFAQTLNHDAIIKFYPNESLLEVKDKLELKNCNTSIPIEIVIHKGLNIQLLDNKKSQLVWIRSEERGVPVDIFKLISESCTWDLKLSGKIFHPPTEELDPGTIQQDGVSLFGSTYWLPTLNSNHLITGQFDFFIPNGWQLVAPGELVKTTNFDEYTSFNWTLNQPHEAMSVFAAPFFVSTLKKGNIESLVYLREQDKELSETFHNLTHDYISHFSEIIGPYPYSKFATVENFWETGYGLPSLTLLGPTVIRLPFLATTSFPHEILHNWWGNGVYTDERQGNWCEGLTTYLADHWLQQKINLDGDYRRTSLKNFKDYVNSDSDFPLSQFQGRYDEISKTIGYDKGYFFFHMLKNKIGENNFYKGLKEFYKNYLFKKAGYFEIQKTFEDVTGEDLYSFFQQWIHRTGSISITLKDIKLKQMSPKKFQIDFKIAQKTDQAYLLDIPIIIKDTHSQSHFYQVKQSEYVKNHQIIIDYIPQELLVDSNFDLFRTLYPEEIPATLSQVLSSTDDKTNVFILNSSKQLDNSKIYESFFNKWTAEQGNQFNISSVSTWNDFVIPDGEMTWIAGWDEVIPKEVIDLLIEQGWTWNGDGKIEMSQNNDMNISTGSSVFVFKRKTGAKTLVWINLDKNTDITRLVSKLTHYGKYSFLKFDSQNTNTHKGNWNTTTSPLTWKF